MTMTGSLCALCDLSESIDHNLSSRRGRQGRQEVPDGDAWVSLRPQAARPRHAQPSSARALITICSLAEAAKKCQMAMLGSLCALCDLGESMITICPLAEAAKAAKNCQMTMTGSLCALCDLGESIDHNLSSRRGRQGRQEVPDGDDWVSLRPQAARPRHAQPSSAKRFGDVIRKPCPSAPVGRACLTRSHPFIYLNKGRERWRRK